MYRFYIFIADILHQHNFAYNTHTVYHNPFEKATNFSMSSLFILAKKWEIYRFLTYKIFMILHLQSQLRNPVTVNPVTGLPISLFKEFA